MKFGSLLVYLPCFSTGGKIHLMKNGNEALSNFDFGLKDDGLMDFNWIAFHRNCKLKTKPTTSGYQIILIYKIIDPTVKDKSFDFRTPSNFTNDLMDLMRFRKFEKYSISFNGSDFDGRNYNFNDY
eukprot:gene6249-10257_t